MCVAGLCGGRAGLVPIGDADARCDRHPGRAFGPHNGVLADVFRGRAERPHAGAAGAYKHKVHVSTAISCVLGEWFSACYVGMS